MNKTDIIKKLAEQIYGGTTVNSIQQAAQFCDTLVEIFTDALLKGEKIIWKGFLSVEALEKDQRRGRNPQTNEVVLFPPSKSVKCKISQVIKDRINKSEDIDGHATI